MGRARGLGSPAPRPSAAPWGVAPASAPPEPHAASPPRRADRARDPRGRPARRLGGGLRRGREARPQRHVHDGHRRDRERLGAARPEPRHAPDDPRASTRRISTPSSAATSRPPRTRCSGPRTSTRPARWWCRTGRRRGLALPGQRAERPPDGVQGDHRRDGRERRGQKLLDQTQRLLASDVIWTDSFQEPAEVVLEEEGIEGLDVPSSEFVTTDDLVSQSSLAAIWQRIQGASTGGTPTGLHGSGIAYVKALPSGQLLSTTTETTIKVTDELALRGRRRGHRARARRSGSR